MDLNRDTSSLEKSKLEGNAMPIFMDQYPSQLLKQAWTALFEWYCKNGLEDEEDGLQGKEHKRRARRKNDETVRRMMKVQFPAEGERIAALVVRSALTRGA